MGNKILGLLSKHNTEEIIKNLLLVLIIVLLSLFGFFVIYELTTQKAIISYNLSEEQKQLLEKQLRKASEFGYLEGQKDAIKGDLRIKIINDSCIIWTKSPWDNVDSNSKFFKPIYDGCEKCYEKGEK